MAKQTKKRKKQLKKQGVQNLSFWKNKDLWFPITIILVITFVVFIPSLNNDFVNWDDDVNILDNPNLQAFTWQNIKGIFTSDVIGNYNPLPIFTFAIEKHFFGLNPTVFHVNNLLLHLVCVFLIYRICLQLGLNIMAAALVALLFGIHPMRVESVAWVTERKDVLFGTFYLGAMFYYLKFLKNEQQKYYAIVLILFIISLFSKIQAVALPLSLLAVDYYLKKDIDWKIILDKIPFFALSLAFGLIGVSMLSHTGSMDDATHYSFFERLTVGAYSYSVYLVKFIFPYEMSPLYPYQNEMPTHYFIGYIGAFAMLAWFIYALKKQQKSIVFGIAFFTFNVMFMLQIVGAGQGLLADRFTYIPYFGLFFLLAYAYQKLVKENPNYKRNLQIGFSAYLLLFAVMTFVQCDVWKNGKTLWTHVIKHYDNAATPFANLGHFYRDENNFQKAIENYSLAIEKGQKASAYNSRGKMYFENGKSTEAMQDYNNGLALATEDKVRSEILSNRGALYGQQNKLDLALKDLNEAAQLYPDNKNAYSMRSMVYFQQNDYANALADYDKILSIDPADVNIWYERGIVLNSQRKNNEALKSFNRAIQLDPKQGMYYAERARCHLDLGNKANALQDVQQARDLGFQVKEDIFSRLQ